MAYQIVTHNLSFTPPSAFSPPVLINVSVQIDAGQFVGIVGGNGAGKSTFLSALAGELNDITGTVRIGQAKIRKPVNQILDGVGVVHQDDRFDLIPHLSIAQNISIRQQLGRGPGTHFLSQEWNNSWFTAMRSELSQYDLNGKFDLEKIVGTLSGGERQQLSILIATRFEHKYNPCKVLLLDEHTAKLDHQNARAVMKLTCQQIKDTGCTAVMISHRYTDVLTHCDRVLVFGRGEIKFDLSKSELSGKDVAWLSSKVDEASQ